MLEGGRLSESELVCMLIYTVLGTGFFFLPALVAAFAGRDAWMTPIAAAAHGLLVALFIGYLSSLFPGFNFFNWTEIILGKVSGKVLQFFYILWFIHVTSVIVNEFDYFVKIAFMPVTPSVVFTILLLTLTGVAVWGGVEMIGRLAIVFLPVSIVISMGLAFMGIGLYHVENLLPVFERGIVPVLAGTLPPSGWVGEIFLGAMLFPFLKRPQKAGYVVLRADLWTCFLLLVDALTVILAFGGETARLSLPVYSLARDINLLSFFQHLESLVLIMWFAGIFVKVAVWEYVTILGLAQWLNLDSYRPLVVPTGLFLAALTSWDMPDVAFLVHYVATVIPFELIAFTTVFPGILVIFSLVRGMTNPHGTKKRGLPSPEVEPG